MARKNKYKNPNQIQEGRGNYWFRHYEQYLYSLAFQLFEWKGLPDSIDPRYLEMMLHQYGYVAFYKDEELGYIVSQGAPSGIIDHYMNPTEFQANSPRYNKRFKLFTYLDMVDEARDQNRGVMIWNNDYRLSSMPSLRMFAEDLAELKEVIYVNQNAQKTPYIIAANDLNLFSVKQVYNQLEGNAPAIFTNENFDPDSLKVLQTNAPVVFPQLNTQKNAVWNECMTWLGIKNANLEKKERMITGEVDSNDEQIDSSGNVWLKARIEACKRINLLYPELNVEVGYRQEIVEELAANAGKEGISDGELHHADRGNYRPVSHEQGIRPKNEN